MLHQMYVGPARATSRNPEVAACHVGAFLFLVLTSCPHFPILELAGGFFRYSLPPSVMGCCLSAAGRLCSHAYPEVCFLSCVVAVFNMFCFGFDLLLGSALATDTGGSFFGVCPPSSGWCWQTQQQAAADRVFDQLSRKVVALRASSHLALASLLVFPLSFNSKKKCIPTTTNKNTHTQRFWKVCTLEANNNVPRATNILDV